MKKPHKTVVCLCEEGLGRSSRIAKHIHHAFTGETKDPVEAGEYDMGFEHGGQRVRLLVRGLEPKYKYGRKLSLKELQDADLVVSDVAGPEYLHAHNRHDLLEEMARKRDYGRISRGWTQVHMTSHEDIRKAVSKALGI